MTTFLGIEIIDPLPEFVLCSFCEKPVLYMEAHFLTRPAIGKKLPVHIACHVEIKNGLDTAPTWDSLPLSIRRWIDREQIPIVITQFR